MIFHTLMKKIEFSNLEINNVAIEPVETFNFRRLTLNQHMNWKSHFDIFSSIIARAISIVNRIQLYYSTRETYSLLLLDILSFQLWYISIG